MFNKIFTVLFLTFITSGELLACPMCSGQDPRDNYYIIIVGVFCIAVYIPMFYLAKTFFKLRNINNQNQNNE